MGVYDESKYDDDYKASDKQVPMTTSKAVKGKTFTAYALDFAEQSRESGDAKQALKWFQRFNGRMPKRKNKFAFPILSKRTMKRRSILIRRSGCQRVGGFLL